MRNFLLGVAATALLSTSVAAGSAMAEPSPQLIYGVDRPGDAVSLERVQFLFGGHNYCWYDLGWQGPGFYWCGYNNRRGLGWGGGDGFRGWHGNHGGGGAHGAPGHGGPQGGHVDAGHAPAAHGGGKAADHGGGDKGGGDKKPG